MLGRALNIRGVADEESTLDAISAWIWRNESEYCNEYDGIEKHALLHESIRRSRQLLESFAKLKRRREDRLIRVQPIIGRGAWGPGV